MEMCNYSIITAVNCSSSNKTIIVIRVTTTPEQSFIAKAIFGKS